MHKIVKNCPILLQNKPNRDPNLGSVKCEPADLRMFTHAKLKCGLILRIFCCGFMGKMRMQMQTDFYVLFILQRQAYCLGLKTVCLF